ncbi:MAG: OsmC family protein [Cytophagales bacterium]
MATASIVYKGELRNLATHLASGVQIISDAPVDNHGKGEAFSPTDLTATSLGLCMMTIMGIYAQKNNIDLKDSTISISKIMSKELPRRIVEIGVELHIKTTNILTEDQKKALENAAHTCPVALSLHPEIKQNVIFSW